MVFNRWGAVVFSVGEQHRDVKGPGISYEDDYKGSALAAMVRRDGIDVRFHRDFDDRAVVGILRELMALPEMAWLAEARVTYQGRLITV